MRGSPLAIVDDERIKVLATQEDPPMRVHRRRRKSEGPDQKSTDEPLDEEPEAEAAEPAAEPLPRPAHEPLLDKGLLQDLANMDHGDFSSLMSQAIGQSKVQGLELEAGDRVQGVVIRRTASHVFVNVGAKQEATMDAEESEAAVGEPIEAWILGIDQDGIRLGTRLRGQQVRENLQAALAAGVPVEGRVVERNSGGFVVDLSGVKAFCPVSQIAMRPGDLDAWIGRTLDFRVIEISRREAVVSHRLIEEEVAEQEAIEFWKTLAVGFALEGPVAAIQSFGVFIDLGPVQGLVPRSKLDGLEPAEGETLKVKIIALDQSAGKITLEPAGRPPAQRKVHEEQGSLGTFADLFKKL